MQHAKQCLSIYAMMWSVKQIMFSWKIRIDTNIRKYAVYSKIFTRRLCVNI